ncbi:hypothetical protein NQ315_011650 [Exocentrus adspersus]|uniref:Tc1-like transposase DDE domain-containing protein n=1 Tax=Exocentrus adspersus TaxID=1586481 RepID=A0AAV8VB09_9CUCU|nr:hypothetical protein NQ315_011650 [Exocentrus adspersus]
MERPEIASKRVDFLREYITNAKCESPLDVVFLDETWIFQHGSNTLQTWHDNDVKSVRKKHCSEGKRYIIVHAGNKEGFIDGAGLIFSTKNKSADYHDNMNSELFEKWMEEQLLPRLKKPSLIVMDNARYHSRLMEKIPNTQSTKDEIIQWLQRQKGYSEEAVYNTWKDALHNVSAQNWADCIRHTENIISTSWEREKILDRQILPLIINFNEDSSSEENNSSYRYNVRQICHCGITVAAADAAADALSAAS